VSAVDVIVVGSGINSLVCGALLAQRGRRVCVLERSDTFGGCIRTEELTLPGFLHDTLSTLYPLFVSAPHFATLQGPLKRHGVSFLNTANPTATLLPNGECIVLTRDRDENIATFERMHAGDGHAYRQAMMALAESAGLTFGLLGGDLRIPATLKLLLRQAWARGLHTLSSYCAQGLESCRSWLERSFAAERSRALVAPWVLHVGLGPDSAASALMAKLVMLTLEQFGAPMVRGGGAHVVRALLEAISDAGGEVHAGADVTRVIVEKNVARGVQLADGREFRARSAVVCNVTPTQLYGRLLAGETLPADVQRQASAFRYGRGEMQIHLALDQPPQWPDERLSKVAMLHLTPGLNGVSRAVDEARRGLLPAEATIVVAQPTALDASRAPAGKSILWIQLQELPRRVLGDAAAILQCPADGAWTIDLRERYADRILARLAQQIPNLERSVLARKVLSPADLEALNVNLVGGDPYSGCCEIDQFLLWRPFPASRNHETPIKKLYHIGASTHPGPGLGGMSGFMVANALA
jgi:phytoene dehydrogenase-like protein